MRGSFRRALLLPSSKIVNTTQERFGASDPGETTLSGAGHLRGAAGHLTHVPTPLEPPGPTGPTGG